MVLLVSIMLFALVFFFQIPGLIEKKLWRELIVFGILLFAGFSISILLALGFHLPFMSDAIGKGVGYIFGIK